MCKELGNKFSDWWQWEDCKYLFNFCLFNLIFFLCFCQIFSLTDDTVLEEHNEDPTLIQMHLIGDGGKYQLFDFLLKITRMDSYLLQYWMHKLTAIRQYALFEMFFYLIFFRVSLFTWVLTWYIFLGNNMLWFSDI